MLKRMYVVSGKFAVYDQFNFLIDVFKVERKAQGATPQEAKINALAAFKRSLVKQYGRGLTIKAASTVIIKPIAPVPEQLNLF